MTALLFGVLRRPCNLALGATWLGLFVTGGALLGCEPSAGLPRTPTVVAPRFLTPEIRAGRTMAQIMTIRAHAFNRIVIEPEPVASEPRGEVVFEIYDHDSGALVRTVTAPGEVVVRGRSFTIVFPPIEESNGRQYRLEVSMPETNSGEGISLWAYDGRAGEDALIVAGTHAFSELVFETGGAPMFRRFARHLWRPPPGVASPAVQFAFVLLASLAFVMLGRVAR